MRTRIRISTALFCMLILGLFGAAIFTYVFKTESRPESWVTPFFSALFFIPFLSVIVWMTLLIRINQGSQTITFIYLFRFQRKSYHFRDITGFRFKYINGRMEYKAIQFQSADGRKFIVTDFETANFRELEKFCLEHFDLKAGKQFRALSEEEKQQEIKKSKEFDISQAKTIRFYFYAVTITTLFFTALAVHKMMKNDAPLPFYGFLPLVVFFAASIVAITKIGKATRQIKTAKERLNDAS